jgi:AraC-like DNA-binding protein
MESVKDICFRFESMITSSTVLKSSSVEGTEQLSDRLLAYFYRHYDEQISLAKVARALGASPSGIMHKVKKETGRTFTELLNGVRIKEAKRLLTFTALPLGEISLRCGFRDQSYFTKVFRKFVNIGPREFRNMLKMELAPSTEKTQ